MQSNSSERKRQRFQRGTPSCRLTLTSLPITSDSISVWHNATQFCWPSCTHRPVSYTHLDVYKRQVHTNLLKQHHTQQYSKAVSYTHLKIVNTTGQIIHSINPVGRITQTTTGQISIIIIIMTIEIGITRIVTIARYTMLSLIHI